MAYYTPASKRKILLVCIFAFLLIGFFCVKRSSAKAIPNPNSIGLLDSQDALDDLHKGLDAAAKEKTYPIPANKDSTTTNTEQWDWMNKTAKNKSNEFIGWMIFVFGLLICLVLLVYCAIKCNTGTDEHYCENEQVSKLQDGMKIELKSTNQ